VLKEAAAIDEATLHEHLERSHRNVAEGQLHIQRQREVIRRLERSGYDSRRAHWLLGTFEDLLRLHVQDRDRLVRDLAALQSVA